MNRCDDISTKKNLEFNHRDNFLQDSSKEMWWVSVTFVICWGDKFQI